MIDPINAASPAPNAFPDVTNSNTDDSKKSSAITEEDQNGGIDVSTQKIDTPKSPIPHEENSNVEAEEKSHIVSAQRDNEANAKSPEVQNELGGTILDILA